MASSARVAAFLDGTSGGGDVGGKEPELKRRKLLDAGGPIEDDETARQKMRDAEVYARGVRGTYGEYVGFDPDNVRDVKSWGVNDADTLDIIAIKPMGYFARNGDLPMMRWLYVNGADTRDEEIVRWFPMRMAAMRGRMEVCKWLVAHGAAKDIKRRTSNGYTPLSAIFHHSPFRDLSRWLILKGALCKDDGSGDLDVGIMKQNPHPNTLLHTEERNLLLEWANDLHRYRTSLLLFLSGALSSAPQRAYRTRRTSSPVRLLSGKSGVLELIGVYTGAVRGREAKIVIQLTELLPDLFD